MFQTSFTTKCLKITYLKTQLHPPVANELTWWGLTKWFHVSRQNYRVLRYQCINVESYFENQSSQKPNSIALAMELRLSCTNPLIWLQSKFPHSSWRTLHQATLNNPQTMVVGPQTLVAASYAIWPAHKRLEAGLSGRAHDYFDLCDLWSTLATLLANWLPVATKLSPQIKLSVPRRVWTGIPAELMVISSQPTLI